MNAHAKLKPDNLTPPPLPPLPSFFLSAAQGTWLGYSHHRWVATLRGGLLALYPKLSFLERFTELTAAVGNNDGALFDLSYFWRGKPAYSVVRREGHVVWGSEG